MSLPVLAFWIVFIICVIFQFPFAEPQVAPYRGVPILVMLGILGWMCLGH
jgi:hypothetical protein